MANTVRPRLRQDTAFLQSSEGTFVRNGDNAIVLKGQSTYRWLSAIGRHLNGKHTVADLCADLSLDQQKTVTEIIDALVENGFAKDAEAEPTAIAVAVRRRFAAQLAFIDHFTDAPVRRFVRFRDSRILLLGNAEMVSAAGRGLLRNGLAELTLDAVVPDLADEAERLTSTGTPASVRVAARDSVDGYDLVAYCGLAEDLTPVYELNERCLRAGVPFLPSVVVDQTAVVGPLVRAGSACWLCALLRLGANVDPRTAAGFWRQIAVHSLADPAQPVPTAVAQMLGNAVAFETFSRLVGGLPTDTDSAVVLQDTGTLESTREELLPYPGCPACGERVDPVPRQPAAVSQDERYAHCQSLFQRRLGILREYADDALPQVPVKVGVVRLSEPAQDVTAFSVDSVVAARLAAISTALVRYTQRVRAPGPLTRSTLAELTHAGGRPAAPGDILTWSGAAPLDDSTALLWTPGTSLCTGGVRHVPAGAVYPSSELNAGSMWERTSAGMGVGGSTAEAASAGLVSVLGHVLLCDLVRGRAAAVELAVDRVADASREVAFLTRSAEVYDPHVELLEAVGTGGVHVVLVRVPDLPTWIVGVGRTTVDAAVRALTDLVGRRQLGEAPAADTPLLAGLTSSAELVRGDPAGSRLYEEPVSDATLLRQVGELGGDAVFVDTTTADLRAHGALWVGRVVLAVSR